MTNFPFDKQSCDLTFGSWTYTGNEIDLSFYSDMEMLDMSDTELDMTQWQIISAQESRIVKGYDFCDDPFVTLKFSLEMKRKMVLSSFILTVPCVLLACMTLVIFCMPLELADRVSLGKHYFAVKFFFSRLIVEANIILIGECAGDSHANAFVSFCCSSHHFLRIPPSSLDSG